MFFLNEISFLPIALSGFAFSLCAFLVSLFRLFFIFDHLLKYQYEHYQDEWLRNGKADGFFWHAEGTTYAEGIQARGHLLETFRQGIPSWVVSNNDTLLLLKKFRFWSMSCRIFVVAFFAFGLTALAVYVRAV